MNQTQKLRGGGTGGSQDRESAKAFFSGSRANRPGGNSVVWPATGGNSLFNADATASDFFCSCLAAAMALHRQHGCAPSKVLLTACDKDSLQRLLASIVVHATVCRAAQCRPVVNTRAATTANFPQRTNTDHSLIRPPGSTRPGLKIHLDIALESDATSLWRKAGSGGGRPPEPFSAFCGVVGSPRHRLRAAAGAKRGEKSPSRFAH